MHLRWCFVYFDGRELVYHKPQSTYDSVRDKGARDAEFIFGDGELHDRLACFWKFDDFSGVIVPSNISDLYSVQTCTDRQALEPMLMQIAYPEYVDEPREFDAELFQYVQRHCLRVPVNDAVETSARKVRAPRVFVHQHYDRLQGGEQGYGNRCHLRITLDIENIVAHSGPIEFRETAVGVSRIAVAGLRAVAVEHIHEIGDARADIAEPAPVSQVIEAPRVAVHGGDAMDVSDADEVIGEGAQSDEGGTAVPGKEMYTLAGTKINLDVVDREALRADTHGWEQRLLTDNVIHFLFGRLRPLRTPVDEHRDVYVMSSFFMKQLMVNTTPTNVQAQAAENYKERLVHWATRDSGEFILHDKQVIIIPYNYSNIHWLLYVVYRPYDRLCNQPLLYVFDSLPTLVTDRVHRMNLTGICTYLREAYVKHSGGQPCLGVAEERWFRKAAVPPQNNSWACGWFMFLFGQQLLVSREARERTLVLAAAGRSVLPAVTPAYVNVYRRKVSEKVFG